MAIEHEVETFDFIDTAAELDAFSPPDNQLRTGDDAIPSVIHFIWGLRDADLTFINYLAIRSALVNAGIDEVKLHYFKLNEENEWFLKLKHDITLVPHRPEDLATAEARASWHVAHLSDVLRMEILFHEGGIYLDMDVFVFRSLAPLLANPKDVVLGHEGGNRWGLCNAVILARPRARFLGRWIESYASFDANEWNYHSVLLPKEMSLEYPDEVSALSPTVFFWPTWTDEHVQYMHDPLDSDAALEVQATLKQTGGGLYGNQLAYHAWSQRANERFLSKLTPESVLHVDTRFNLLVRPIVLL